MKAWSSTGLAWPGLACLPAEFVNSIKSCSHSSTKVYPNVDERHRWAPWVAKCIANIRKISSFIHRIISNRWVFLQHILVLFLLLFILPEFRCILRHKMGDAYMRRFAYTTGTCERRDWSHYFRWNSSTQINNDIFTTVGMLIIIIGGRGACWQTGSSLTPGPKRGWADGGGKVKPERNRPR